MRDVQNFNMGYALMEVAIEEAAGGTSPASGVEGLIGMWHLNEDEGLIAKDASSVHNDGTMVGPTWSTGVRGAALHFNGTPDRVAIPEVPEYNVGEGITVMAWLRWDIDPVNGTPWACIVCKAEKQWELMHNGNASTGHTNDAFEFAVNTTDNRTWAWSTTEPVANIWYHVTGTYDSVAGEIKLYVNGTLENTTSLTGLISVVHQDMGIGARYRFGAWDRGFYGDIDEVMIFDHALTQDEINRYYQSLKP
jgi:hypothetical protein